MTTNSRFAWSRVDNVTGCYELKRRNIQRELYVDANLRCYVKACNRYCKDGDICYYPTKHVGPDNKILAHVECVDRLVAEHTAKSSKEAQANQTKGLILLPDVVPGSAGKKPLSSPKKGADAKVTVAVANVPGTGLGDGSDLLLQIEKLRQKIWQEGFEAGIAAALAKLNGVEEEARGA